MEKDEEEMRRKTKNRNIIEGYKIWKKNTPLLYNIVISRRLECPSLTVEWLPDRKEQPGKDCLVQTVILGTHAAKNEPNYLMRAEVKLPLENSGIDEWYNYDTGLELRRSRRYIRKVKIVQKIKHERHVNRARYMPQKPFIIATKTVRPEVYVFDYRKHSDEPTTSDGGSFIPDLRLRGHDMGGYSLSWSQFKEGHLLSGSNQICLWDINATPNNKSIDAISMIRGHYVRDVAWHRKHEDLFGSVGNDKCLHVWDIRVPSISQPLHSVVAHQSKVNCLDFNPFNEWAVVTGSSDKTVKVFDTRKIDPALHTFDCHEDAVSQVGWNPKNETVFASSGFDRRLMIWDLGRTGGKDSLKLALDRPPELLFIHSGHTSEVTDFSWNSHEDLLVASVAEDNKLQIWQMADNIYLDDSNDPPQDDSTKGSHVLELACVASKVVKI